MLAQNATVTAEFSDYLDRVIALHKQGTGGFVDCQSAVKARRAECVALGTFGKK